MAERLRWWVIPGALVVLAHTVQLPSPPPTGPRGDAVPAAAGDGRSAVVLADATGRRQRAEVEFAAERAFVVELPQELAGRGIEMLLWRRLDGEREASPWLELRPTVRDDATVPIVGLPAGRYDVEVRSAGLRLCADDQPMPGRAAPAPAPAR